MFDNLLVSFAAVLASASAAQTTAFKSSAQIETEIHAPIVGAWRLELEEDVGKRVEEAKKNAKSAQDPQSNSKLNTKSNSKLNSESNTGFNKEPNIQPNSKIEVVALNEGSHAADIVVSQADTQAEQQKVSELDDEARKEPDISNSTLLGAEVSFHQPNPACTEDYNFKPDGKMLVVSDTERTFGEYNIINKSSLSLPIIVLKTVYDNNQPDCSGVKRNQSGESFMAYLSQESSNRFKLCNQEDATECFMTFNRILP